MKQLTFVTLFCFVSALASYAQDVSSELKFARYLENSKQFKDQIYILNELLKSNPTNISQKDSIHYYLGRGYYRVQQLDSSALMFGQVTYENPELRIPSVFWNSYLNNHLGRFSQAHDILGSLDISEKKYLALKNFQTAGNALLQRNHDLFNQSSKGFNGEFFQFAVQEDKLKELNESLLNRKRKSPVLAGLMSAIVPGSGKIYSGKVGQGIATIFATTIMSLQAYEGYRKDGSNSPRFILYASVLSTFYIANIWGSVLSVKVREREFNDTIDKEILFSMHIPLRTIFN